MRVLIRSGNESLVDSVRIALDANDIPHEDQSFLAWARTDTVLVDDEDYARAVELVKELQVTSASAGMVSPRFRAALIVTGALLALMIITSVVIAFLK